MILVAGESLIDLIVGPHGDVHASPGGGPFNTARTIARLGQPVRFLGRLSADPFGALLAGKLADDHVELVLPEQVPEPTALAIVSVNEAGVARYWFHLTGTAGFVLDQPSAGQALRADVTALHIGTLGLVVEPMGGAVESLAGQLPSSVLLMLDPNWRASAIPDPSAHLARIRRLLPRTDILKTTSKTCRSWPQATSRRRPGRCSAGARGVSWSPTARRRCGRSRRTGSSSRCRRHPPRWWTRSGPETRSAAASWPGGLSAGWTGTSWPTPVGWRRPSRRGPGWPP